MSGENTRLNGSGPAPELACGVLARSGGPSLVEAVESLLSQSEPVEVVVVNSHGGDPEAALREAGIHVPVITCEQRLFPGAVRNIAIEATGAPYVAFLAADCRAEPGWAAGRLREHRAGAATVACTMSSATPGNASSNAALLLQHNRRLPDTPAHHRLFYGLSYRRDVLERVGGFPEDLRSGEDSIVNARLAAESQPVWADDVSCAHLYPTTPRSLVRDLYSRGRRRAAMRRLQGEPFSWSMVRSALKNAWRSSQQARLTTDPVARGRLLRARPLIPVGALATALGMGLQRWALFHRPDHEYRVAPPSPRPVPGLTPGTPAPAQAGGARDPVRR